MIRDEMKKRICDLEHQIRVLENEVCTLKGEIGGVERQFHISLKALDHSKGRVRELTAENKELKFGVACLPGKWEPAPSMCWLDVLEDRVNDIEKTLKYGGYDTCPECGKHL